jgi:hypothetical protein
MAWPSADCTIPLSGEKTGTHSPDTVPKDSRNHPSRKRIACGGLGQEPAGGGGSDATTKFHSRPTCSHLVKDAVVARLSRMRVTAVVADCLGPVEDLIARARMTGPLPIPLRSHGSPRRCCRLVARACRTACGHMVGKRTPGMGGTLTPHSPAGSPFFPGLWDATRGRRQRGRRSARAANACRSRTATRKKGNPSRPTRRVATPAPAEAYYC